MQKTEYYFVVPEYELLAIIYAESLNKAIEVFGDEYGFKNFEAMTKAQYERKYGDV